MPGEMRKIRNSSGKRSSRHAEERIAATLARQHGVIDHEQLLEYGLSDDDIGYRLRIGRLHRVFPRAYAVGSPALSWRGRFLAATRSLGSTSLISHTSAAALHDLRSAAGRIHVAVDGNLRRRAGVILHRFAVPPDERTRIDGIPATGLSRTLFDLAASEGRETLVRSLREAEYRRLTDRLSLLDLLERYPHRRGAGVVRAVLADRGSFTGRTRSPLEDEFLAFLDRYGLPRPRTNALIEVGERTFEVDCVWDQQRFAVELDGRDAHMTEDSFEADRERDLALQSVGWRTGRVTGRRLSRDPDGLAAELEAILGPR